MRLNRAIEWVKRRRFELLVIAIAIFLRFYDLGKAPLFFDESVHTVFVENVLNWNYRYDPAFHGPLLFYLTAPVVALLGESEFTYRIVPAVFGVLTVALLFKFRRFIGFGAEVSALLVAVSPIIVNYSRFFRNESQILFFTLLFVYGIFMYFEERKRRYLILAFASLALFACSKENFYPMVFLFALFFLFDIRKFRIVDLVISCVVFILIYTALYTNFYTTLDYLNPDKLPFYLAFKYWKHQHDIARIGGPFYYYIPLLLLYDLPVFVLGVYAVVKWIKCRELNHFKAFLIYWFVATLLFYSYMQEKVPWLTVHIELPLYIIAGICIAEIKAKRRVVLALTVLFLLYSSIHLNIVNPTNPAEPALYLPTSMDVKEFRDELKAMNVSNVCVFMSAGDYWPLPCYLEDFHTCYYSDVKDFESKLKACRCEVVILNQTNDLLVGDELKGYEKRELCLRSWVSYSVENLNVYRILEFLVFRKPMGQVCYFNHSVYYLR
jgi:uncharacterized protein (TIGR03663 family)